MSEYVEVLQAQLDRQEEQYNNFFIEIANYSAQLVDGVHQLDSIINDLEEGSAKFEANAGARDATYIIATELAKILKRNI